MTAHHGADDPLAVLRLPQSVLACPQAWAQIAAGGLFAVLQHGVRAGARDPDRTLAAVDTALEAWKAFLITKHPTLWPVVQAMCTCAKIAALDPAEGVGALGPLLQRLAPGRPVPDGFQCVAGTLEDWPGFLRATVMSAFHIETAVIRAEGAGGPRPAAQSDSPAAPMLSDTPVALTALPMSGAWACDLVARLRSDASHAPVRTARIGVLLVAGEGQQATLQLEAFPGNGTLYADPVHALLECDDAFPSALETARRCVRALGLWPAGFTPDIRWTLTRHDGRPIASIVGPSAGLAFGLGLGKLLADLQPELHVPVAAQLRRIALGGTAATAKLTPTGALEAVGGLIKKLHRITRVRTVLIASSQGELPTDLALRPGTPIRVAPGDDFQVEGVATLADAIACLDRRSPLAVGVRAYLQAHVDLSVGPRPLWAAGLSPYVEPDVARWNPQARPVSAEREVREQFARADDAQDRRPWRDVWPGVERAVVLGRPGEGKTVLSQLTARAVAQASLAALDSGAAAPEDVALPIWLRAADVTEKGSIERAALHQAWHVMRKAFEVAYPEPRERPSPTAATMHVCAALARASTWIFLDALDEAGAGGLGRRVMVDPASDLGRLDAPLAGAAEDLRSGLARLSGHVVVTGRPYAYTRAELFAPDDARVFEYALQPLSGKQQAAFIREQWFRDHPPRGEQVLTQMQAHPQFRELATNPLMLTLVCLTATPQPYARRPFDETTRRVHLYEWAVRDLVAGVHKYPQPRRRDDDPRLDRELAVLERAAWAVFNAQPGDSPFTADAWEAALQAGGAHVSEARRAEVLEALMEELPAVGLLVSPAHRTWMFLHRQFLEYLAAAGLAREEETSRIVEVFATHVSDPRWREVLRFTIGVLALRDATRLGTVVNQVLDREPGAPGEAVALIGDAMAEAPGVGVPAATRTRIVSLLLTTMRDDRRVEARMRAAVGTVLGRVGDPRFDAERWGLPRDDLMGFVEIPAGTFRMGSDAGDTQAFPDERPPHPVTLPAYYIATYPVTVGQFGAFVQDTEGNDGFVPGDPRCLDGVMNHPVVRVSWDEAVRYCAWLTEQLRAVSVPAGTPDGVRCLLGRLRGEYGEVPWVATLASEAEWERVARGTDGRIYSWKGNKLDPNLANVDYTGIRGTSAVGCFPGGRSPEGAEDMIGNCAEWVRSLYRPYPYAAGDGREGPWVEGNNYRVTRGGSFNLFSLDWLARAAARSNWNRPDVRDYLLGFRVVVAPFFSDL